MTRRTVSPPGPGTLAERAATKAPRVIITHDFMETYGGAERVTAEMAEAFPDAPVYALLGRRSVAARMGVADRFVSLVPPRERVLRGYRLATPAWGAFADRVRLPKADAVLSSSYAFAHRLRTVNDAPIVCYCHGPLRFAWSMTQPYREEWARSRPQELAFDALASLARRSDRRAAGRVASYLTQSPFTADQIKQFYGREADIIGAPIDARLFRPADRPSGRPPYWLLVSRLIEPYKRVGMVVEAFRRMPDLHLVVVGDGPAALQLVRTAPSNVELTGELGDRDLVHLMQHCDAAICPSREDFGLVPVEIMACGRPVLAYGDGGALHTVVPGLSGEHFGEQTPEAMVAAVRAFDAAVYDSTAIRAHALQWDRPYLHQRLVDAVTAVIASSNGSG